MVRKKLDCIFYYRLKCPYCERFDSYVLEPLEFEGYIRVKRICVDLFADHPLLKVNEWVSENLGIKGDYIVPLLVVNQGKKERIGKMVFGIYTGGESYPLEKEVAIMARSFIDYLCIRLGILKDEVLLHPLIRKAYYGIR